MHCCCEIPWALLWAQPSADSWKAGALLRVRRCLPWRPRYPPVLARISAKSMWASVRVPSISAEHGGRRAVSAPRHKTARRRRNPLTCPGGRQTSSKLFDSFHTRLIGLKSNSRKDTYRTLSLCMSKVLDGRWSEPQRPRARGYRPARQCGLHVCESSCGYGRSRCRRAAATCLKGSGNDPVL